MYKLVEIKPLPEYQLWARFNDGTEGIININKVSIEDMTLKEVN